jgi:hypothetical protein
MSLAERLEHKSKELDRIANLWNKTKDSKYKEQWYKILNSEKDEPQVNKTLRAKYL